MEFHAWRVYLRDGRELEGVDDYPKLDLYPLMHKIELTILSGHVFTLENIPEGNVPYLRRRCWIDTKGGQTVGRGYFYMLGDGAGREWHITPEGRVCQIEGAQR